MKGRKCWLCPAEQAEDDCFCAECRAEIEADFRQQFVSAGTVTVLDIEPKTWYDQTINQSGGRGTPIPTTSPAKGPPKHE